MIDTTQDLLMSTWRLWWESWRTWSIAYSRILGNDEKHRDQGATALNWHPPFLVLLSS